GLGRTTCSYFLPGDKSILYASTHLSGKDCPKEPERKPGGKYLWPVYDGYDIFVADLNGKIKKQLTNIKGYDAEATVSPKGNKILFSSNYKGTRGFQFNIFMMNEDGTGLEQITYDGVFDSFPMFSYDGKKLVFSSNRHNGGTHNTNLFVADWVE